MVKAVENTPSNNSSTPVLYILLVIVAIVFYFIGNQQIKTNTEAIPTPEKEISQKIEPTEPPQETQAVVEPTDQPEPTIEVIKVYREGFLDIKPNQKADLDEGVIGNAEADISLEINGPNARYLTPLNGAAIRNVGESSVDIDKCKIMDFTKLKVPIEYFPPGTYVCYFTNGSRYGELKVLQDVKQAGMLRISFTTWE